MFQVVDASKTLVYRIASVMIQFVGAIPTVNFSLAVGYVNGEGLFVSDQTIEATVPPADVATILGAVPPPSTTRGNDTGSVWLQYFVDNGILSGDVEAVV
jgi:hypothetical protein